MLLNMNYEVLTSFLLEASKKNFFSAKLLCSRNLLTMYRLSFVLPCIILNVLFIYNLLERESNQTPITLDDTPCQHNKVGSTFTAYGINLQNYDIETLAEGKMMNDNIVTVLFRQVFLFDNNRPGIASLQ
jgi:hypothetical protein